MKRPTVASLKKVTPENLAGLGAERLAEILAGFAASRPDLKRRLRMELAAAQGSEHLAVEIDKRLATLEGSRSKVSWRQRPALIRDLDGLRALIATRLAELDAQGATARLWQFLDLAGPLMGRMRDKDGTLARVFAAAAGDLGALRPQPDLAEYAGRLVEAMTSSPVRWADWLAPLLDVAPEGVAERALILMGARAGASPAWMPLLRQLADAASNPDAYRATYGETALKSAATAAEVARRLLDAGRIDEAGDVLRGAAPPAKGSAVFGRRPAEPDFEWETVWIDYLEKSGEPQRAQDARWASFERTLSAARAKAFVGRLSGFDDVEAESRAFAYAARHPDLVGALRLLMDWPALVEAAQMIVARADEIAVGPEDAELWAAKLRVRQPEAATILLRKAAAAAFRRRDFATCDRLSQEADTITP